MQFTPDGPLRPGEKISHCSMLQNMPTPGCCLRADNAPTTSFQQKLMKQLKLYAQMVWEIITQNLFHYLFFTYSRLVNTFQSFLISFLWISMYFTGRLVTRTSRTKRDQVSYGNSVQHIPSGMITLVLLRGTWRERLWYLNIKSNLHCKVRKNQQGKSSFNR